MKSLRKLKYPALLLFAGALAVLYFYAPRFIIDTRIKKPFSARKKAALFPVPENYILRKFHFRSLDGLLLSALEICPKDTIEGTLVVLHGIRAWKESMISKALVLSEGRRRILIPDLRAHGESEGRFTTFGFCEKEDVKALLNHADSVFKDGGNYGIFGQSLGGAIALQALAEEPRLKYGIIESTFSDLSPTVHDYAEFHLGFEFKALTDFLLYRAEQIADFKADSVKPCISCKNIDVPVLFAHGTDDRRIPLRENRLNFENIPHNKKEFIEIEGAGHLNLWSVGGEAWRHRILTFADKYSHL